MDSFAYTILMHFIYVTASDYLDFLIIPAIPASK